MKYRITETTVHEIEAECEAHAEALWLEHGRSHPSVEFVEVSSRDFEQVECEDCDGFGRCWNNADPTSGQWVECPSCGNLHAH